MTSAVSDAIARIDAGSWPDWLAAVATSIAVLVAAFTYKKSRNDDHFRQARKVYVLHSSDRRDEGQWVDTGEGWAEAGALRPWPDEVRGYQLKTKGVHVRAKVHNASDEVISNVEVVVSADNVENWPQGPRDARYVIAAIPPGADHLVHFIAKDLWSDGHGVMGLDLSVRLRFTDSTGTHWTRRDARPVRELKRYVGRPMEPGLHTYVKDVSQ